MPQDSSVSTAASEEPISAAALGQQLEEPLSTAALGQQLAASPPRAETRFASSVEFGGTVLKRVFFVNIMPLIKAAARAPLTVLDLPPLDARDEAATVFKAWEAAWAADAATAAASQPTAPPSVTRVLWALHGATYFKSLALAGCGFSMQFAPPFCLRRIITSLQPGGEAVLGYAWCAALFCCGVFGTICTQHGVHCAFRLAMHVKTQLVLAIYRKTFRASQRTRVMHSQGETVNLMSVDAQRFADSFPIFLWGVMAPGVIIVSLTWLSTEVGGTALGGSFCVILPFIMAMVLVGKHSGGMVKQMQRLKDERVKVSSDAIAGIRVVKYYGWEQSVVDKVRAVRREEMKTTRAIAMCKGVTGALGMTIPSILSAAMFTIYSLHSGRDIEAKQAAMTIVLVNVVKMPLHILPLAIIVGVMTIVSLRRINTYLNGSEACMDGFDVDEAVDRGPADALIEVPSGTVFSWEQGEGDGDSESKDESKGKEGKGRGTGRDQAKDSIEADGERSAEGGATAAQLHAPFRLELELRLQGPQLVGLVGAVGDGKSSTLAALLGEMTLSSGTVKRRGRLAMCEQVPWICNATVRENILFGRTFDAARYAEALHAAALDDDISILVSGDATEIGERGINLSGGQKARVALARAFYTDADIYFLDDVLSAVDVHVGAHIFEHGIRGLLRGKLVVFATNQLHLLPSFDEVLFLKAGAVCARGRAEELEKSCAPFGALMHEYNQQLATKEAAAHESEDAAEDGAEDVGAGGVVARESDGGGAGGGEVLPPALVRKNEHTGEQTAAQLDKGKIT